METDLSMEAGEEALRQSKAMFESLFESVPDGIVLVDPAGRIILANSQAERMFGYSRVELRSQPIELLVPERFRQQHEAHRKQYEANPHIRPMGLGLDLYGRRKDGSEFPVDITLGPLQMATGSAVLTTIRDITERKQVEARVLTLNLELEQRVIERTVQLEAANAALESQRAFLRQIIDINPHFIFAKDRQGRFTLVNQAVAEAYGTSVEELIGKTDADFNPSPDEIDHFQSDDQQVMDTLQEKFIAEERLTDAAGQTRWLQTVKRPIVEADGTAGQILGVATDITEQKRIEEALRLSRNQLAVILQGIADGITAQDPSGRLTYANDAAARFIGYPSAEALLAAPLDEVMQRFDLFDEQGRPFPVEQLPGQQALQGELASEATIRFRIVDTSEERWSVVKARPIFNEQGQVELAVNIFQDITELKRVEQAQRLLAEVGRVLTGSLDYTATLANVAQLAVPSLADWCAVHIVETDQSVRQLAVAHANPAKVGLAYELQRRYPFNPEEPSGVPKVLRTGQPEFYQVIPQSTLRTIARDEQHFQLLQELNITSAMIVPLVARGRTLGAITFVSAESSHCYAPADLALAEELARRVALVVDNARLYREAQDEITARGRVEEQLKASLQETERLLQEKEALLKEVYHRVKNNLQAVSNLLYLQSSTIQDVQVRELFRETQDRLKSIALIHEKLYQTQDLARLDLAGYISSLASYLIHSYKVDPAAIELKVKVDDVNLDMDMAVPLGVIINELISNSLKHAFPADQAGEIWVELQEGSQGELLLLVGDNGIGLPETVDITNTSSLGLQLVHLLAGHFQGKVELERGAGTTFKIYLPQLA